MGKNNEFKASTVELAKKNGLAELGLTEEEANIEVLATGGIFAKALVRITPKIKEEISVFEQTENPQIAENSEENEIAETTDLSEEYTEEVAIETSFEEAQAVVSESESEKQEKVLSPEEKEARFALMKEMRENGKAFVKQTAFLMGANVNVEGKVREDEVCFYISGEDARMFIGYKGETLEAMQTLVSHYLNKDREDRIRIIVDADFYRERRKKTLIALAKKLAKQAYNQHREISLEPMNSYERRIIHFALQNSYDATTRSDGEGKYRHIVIVPKSPIMSYGNTSSEFRKKGPSKTKSFGYNKRKF